MSPSDGAVEAAAVDPRDPRRVRAGVGRVDVAAEVERVGLVVRLVVLRRGHLQHRVVPDRGHERVAREREPLADLDAPLLRDLTRDALERGEVGTVVAQLNRSTNIAMP